MLYTIPQFQSFFSLSVSEKHLPIKIIIKHTV